VKVGVGGLRILEIGAIHVKVRVLRFRGGGGVGGSQVLKSRM
jgi:hypothetical protein